jgi:MFS family permease
MGFFRRQKINRVVMTLVYTDFLFYTAAGFLSPIVAIFYAEGVSGGSIAIAGMVTALFWVVKSAVQVPVSIYADRKKGEGDDFTLMFTGYVIISFVFLGYYLFVDQAWQVFVMEAAKAVGYGLMIPTYMAMYTRHIDKNRENTEWTLHSNAVGLGFAAAAAVGGLLAETFGFRAVFLLTFLLSLLAPVVLLIIRKEIMGEKGDGNGDGGLMLNHHKQITGS